MNKSWLIWLNRNRSFHYNARKLSLAVGLSTSRLVEDLQAMQGVQETEGRVESGEH